MRTLLTLVGRSFLTLGSTSLGFTEWSSPSSIVLDLLAFLAGWTPADFLAAKHATATWVQGLRLRLALPGSAFPLFSISSLLQLNKPPIPRVLQ